MAVHHHKGEESIDDLGRHTTSLQRPHRCTSTPATTLIRVSMKPHQAKSVIMPQSQNRKLSKGPRWRCTQVAVTGLEWEGHVDSLPSAL